MNLTYVIADTHGRADLFLAAIDAIRTHAEAQEPGARTFIVLGDFVDRGLRSAEIITWLRERAWPNWQKIVLQGNHEAMMLETITKPLQPDWWMGNGGNATLFSYGAKDGMLVRNCYDLIPQKDLDWLKALPLYHMDQHRLYVHAGVNCQVPIEQQREESMQWLIWPKGADVDFFGRHIVHGHEQSEHHPLLLKNRTNLDSFAWNTGKLAIGIFDDDRPGGPIATPFVIGGNYAEHRRSVSP